MRRALLLAAVLCGACVPAAPAAEPPTAWDGANPFSCVLQQAGLGAEVPFPDADPYCVEFDKRRQNVVALGVADFLSKEPARVAAATDKCFYFQSDHWRGSVVQDDAATKTYEWDGHYFFDKAKGEGGVWVTNFNVNGQTGDPRQVPGFPEEWKPFFGPGKGGVRTRNEVDADPQCVERAKREGDRIYASGRRPPRCVTPAGRVSRHGLGPVRLGQSEGAVRRLLGPPRVVKRGWLRWCVVGGGRFLAAQPGDRSGDLGQSEADPTVLVLSTHRAFRHRRVGTGTSLRTLRRRLRGERRVLRYGHTRVWARRGSPVLFGVRGRQVRFVAVRDTRAVRGKRAIRSYLRRSR